MSLISEYMNNLEVWRNAASASSANKSPPKISPGKLVTFKCDPKKEKQQKSAASISGTAFLEKFSLLKTLNV